MRKLVILRGSMGAGKSTWIKQHGLEAHTLCVDTIRLQLASPQLGIGGRNIISQKDNKAAWDLLFFFLEERMKRGEFTIIDAVHSKSSEFTRYNELAEQYRYRLYCVDFSNVPIEIAKMRNKQRPEYKRVPDEAIDRVYSRFATQEIPSRFKVVAPEDFEQVLTTRSYDWNNYYHIHIFGDIHGCFEPIKEYFQQYPFSENDGYIFVGDYFDRGVQNVEVCKWLIEMINKPNTLFLTGNHEQSLRDYAFNMPVKSKEFLNKTAVQFAEAGITQSDLRQIYRKLGVAAYITFRGHDFIISHGGIPYMPNDSMDFYSADSFIRGIGNYEDDIDELFDNWAQEYNKDKVNDHDLYQIHGHRNLYNYPLVHKEYSYNLEGKIEFGGHLRVLRVLGDGSFNPLEIKNNTFSQELLEERDSSNNGFIPNKISNVGMFTQSLRNSKFIQEKMLGDNISSFNFTRSAFDKGIWNNITTQARGLFIDIKNEKIQARSYNKFFNKNEREETRFGYLVQNLKFPVCFYKKYNGFLGILSMKDGELYFCSKSVDHGDYVEYFKNIFYRTYSESQIDAIKDRFNKEDITMVFEVIDPINDQHIIKNSRQELVLLDMIYNKIDFQKVRYDHLVSFGERNRIKVKELVYEVNNIQEFMTLNKEVEATDYKLNGEYIEGFVVEDAEGFMFKYKLYYYNLWKSLRWVLHTYLKNPTSVNKWASSLTTPVENYFLKFIRDKYPNGEKTEGYIMTDIVAERDDFIRNGGSEL